MGKKKSHHKKKVLSEYKKQGAKFIAPMNYSLDGLKSVSYARQTLPQLIWWDVLASQISLQFAIDLAGGIASHFKDSEIKNCWWAFISDYSKLSSEQFDLLKDDLNRFGLLKRLQNGFEEFLSIYPECPLSGFMPPGFKKNFNKEYTVAFEERLEELSDKRSRSAVLMQAQAVYMGFALDKLKVVQGLALADFPKVVDYPNLDRSLEVGGAICSVVNGLAGQMLPDYSQDDWVIYFWSQNFRIRPFTFDHLEQNG